ncbi:hypothetical protein DRN67_03195 [Candidatus Micrarchaeota archaeon]|nr:MAG: hypothetical protein DRN67_03195 [Candidatus Micrarchaeota archaeon]
MRKVSEPLLIERARLERVEPWWLSIILAPFRLVKRFFGWVLSKFPMTDYLLTEYGRNKEDVEEEMEEVLVSTKELERRLKKMEAEVED